MLGHETQAQEVAAAQLPKLREALRSCCEVNRFGVEVGQSLKAARSDRVAEILDTLAALGQAEILADGRCTAE